MEFKVIIDDSLLALSIGSEKTRNSSNNLIGIVNDFEDGKWRYEKFNNFVWDNIADTALSMREREALESKPRTILIESAKKLRLSSSDDDISKGSELAEIVFSINKTPKTMQRVLIAFILLLARMVDLRSGSEKPNSTKALKMLGFQASLNLSAILSGQIS